MDKFLNQYLETALWSSADESTESGGYPLDDNYAIDDIGSETIEQAKLDIEEFKLKAGSLIDDFEDSNLGHDFWLTRNGHGAGFWDGDYPKEIGEKLTEISKTFKELHTIIGDDKKIHFEG